MTAVTSGAPTRTRVRPSTSHATPGLGRRVLLPLPTEGFDVTEVAVTWKILTSAGFRVVFATPEGKGPAKGDPRLVEGVITTGNKGIFGKLNPSPAALADYREMLTSPEFSKPIAWSDIAPAQYDGLFLPGGHAPAMREYLGSALLQQKVADFWALERPVAAICHGPLVLARARDANGQSLIADRRMTSLPKYREFTAYNLSRWKLGSYYRTYPLYVEDEVKSVLRDPKQFVRGPLDFFSAASDERRPLVVDDRNLLTARLPGDARALATKFVQLLARE